MNQRHALRVQPGLIVWAALLAGCARERARPATEVPPGSAEPASSARLELIVDPGEGDAPLPVRLQAELVGDVENAERFQCPSLAWVLGNGEVLITRAKDCRTGEIPRVFDLDYTYAAAGSYDASVRLLALDVEPSNSVPVLVRGATPTPAPAAALPGPTIIIATVGTPGTPERAGTRVALAPSSTAGGTLQPVGTRVALAPPSTTPGAGPPRTSATTPVGGGRVEVSPPPAVSATMPAPTRAGTVALGPTLRPGTATGALTRRPPTPAPGQPPAIRTGRTIFALASPTRRPVVVVASPRPPASPGRVTALPSPVTAPTLRPTATAPVVTAARPATAVGRPAPRPSSTAPPAPPVAPPVVTATSSGPPRVGPAPTRAVRAPTATVALIKTPVGRERTVTVAPVPSRPAGRVATAPPIRRASPTLYRPPAARFITPPPTRPRTARPATVAPSTPPTVVAPVTAPAGPRPELPVEPSPIQPGPLVVPLVTLPAGPIPSQTQTGPVQLTAAPTTPAQPHREPSPTVVAPAGRPVPAKGAAARVMPADLYYLAGEPQQVWRIAATGGAPEQLTRAAAPVEAYAVSPAGLLAAVVGGALELTIPGTTPRALVRSGASAPVWSADGRRLAFGADGVQVYDLATGQTTELAPEGEPVAWSRDGTWLLIRTPGGQPVVVHVRTGARIRLPVAPAITGGWLPDRDVVWLADPGLRLMAFEGTLTLNTILPEDAVVAHVFIRPDGHMLVIAELGAGPSPYAIDLNSDTLTPQLVGPPIQIGARTDFAWAPDGRHAALVSAEGLQFIDPFTGAGVPLATGPVSQPTWVLTSR